MNFDDLTINSSSALFLDRDGVINRRLPGTYVKNVRDFEILPGVLEAFRIFRDVFPYIIIVTNQQGIGKGFMTDGELNVIHRYFIDEVKRYGGRIDEIFYAPDLANAPGNMRKPGTGMALAALQKYPDIDLSSSVMAGDSVSDLEFARNAGMQAVYIQTEAQTSVKKELYNMKFASLLDFAQYIKNVNTV